MESLQFSGYFEASGLARLCLPVWGGPILATERAGVTNVTLLMPTTPWCVLQYYRDELNAMVGYGAKTSFIEVFRKAEEWWMHR